MPKPKHQGQSPLKRPAKPQPGAGPSLPPSGGQGAPSLALIAGLIAGGCSDGAGPSARFLQPTGVALGLDGNLYVTDTGNHTIRKVTPSGVVTTFAGTPGLAGSEDGTGAAARFNGPTGIVLDQACNAYISDTNNSTIRKITPAGSVTTLAGTAGLQGSADGLGAAARFATPYGMTLDYAGNLQVVDSNNNTIRTVTPAGQVSTLAGTAGTSGAADGVGAAARFSNPNFIVMNTSGTFLVTDSTNNTIRMITPDGAVTTWAGTAGPGACVDGTGSAARFNFPFGLAVDNYDNVYVAEETSDTIRQITHQGVVSTLAGSPNLSGFTDGVGTSARFYGPSGLAVDRFGRIWVADNWNNTLRTVTRLGEVATLAGDGRSSSVDGPGASARFQSPCAPAVDAAGNVYIPDHGGHTIRRVTPSGEVTTFAGCAGEPGCVDGVGPAARFKKPNAVALDAAGNLYVSDSGNKAVRKITPSGVVTTMAGNAKVPDNLDGSGPAAGFNDLVALAVDRSGQVYVADGQTHAIWRITPAGVVSLFAGTAGTPGSVDAVGAAASFDNPYGLAMDAAGNLYVSEYTNSTIRKVTPTGTVTTLAGKALAYGSADGTGAEARFAQPEGLAMSPSGDLYVVDCGNMTIRKVTPAGVVTTVLGTAGRNMAVPGTPPGSWFTPQNLNVDPTTGDLYVTKLNALLKVSW